MNDINDKRGPLIAKQLREYAHNPGYNHADYSDVMLKAADYIDAALPAMREYAKKMTPNAELTGVAKRSPS